MTHNIYFIILCASLIAPLFLCMLLYILFLFFCFFLELFLYIIIKLFLKHIKIPSSLDDPELEDFALRANPMDFTYPGILKDVFPILSYLVYPFFKQKLKKLYFFFFK